MLLRTLLAQLGYEVCVLTSGVDLLNAHAACSFDVVFADACLNDVSGLFVMSELRSARSRTRVPHRVLTISHDDSKYLKYHAATYAEAVLEKPLRKTELMHVLGELIDAPILDGVGLANAA